MGPEAVMLALGLLAWAAILVWVLCILRSGSVEPILPPPNHLSCGECVWLLPAAFPENRGPANLVDQLVISPFCTEHNTFAWKRWNEKHLDDKGLKNPRQTDVDNYRGLLED